MFWTDFSVNKSRDFFGEISPGDFLEGGTDSDEEEVEGRETELEERGVWTVFLLPILEKSVIRRNNYKEYRQ